jgi:hypothetical protein
MSLFRQPIGLLIFATILAVASTSAGDEWTDFHIVIDPSSPTNEETFDLRAFRWFGDSGRDMAHTVAAYVGRILIC